MAGFQSWSSLRYYRSDWRARQSSSQLVESFENRNVVFIGNFISEQTIITGGVPQDYVGDSSVLNLYAPTGSDYRK